MGSEEPSNIIRSWNLQSSFGAGAVVSESLVPRRYGRTRTPFVCVWREEQLNSILDFSSENFSVYMPESLRVLKEAYLKIEVPASPSALKKFPGLYFIERIRLLSAGGVHVRLQAAPGGPPAADAPTPVHPLREGLPRARGHHEQRRADHHPAAFAPE